MELEKSIYCKAEVCGELEEDAGVEGSDPGPAEAGGHSEEARRASRSVPNVECGLVQKAPVFWTRRLKFTL